MSERKFLRIYESDDRGIAVQETYECANTDVATLVSTLRTATFSGFGLTNMPSREVSAKEHTPRRNVAQVTVVYSNKWTGGGRRVLSENLGNGVVLIVPVMSSRVPQKEGYPVGTPYPGGDGTVVMWEFTDNHEAFLIESQLALVVMKMAVALTETFVSTIMALVGTVNSGALANFGGAGAKTLLMLSPRVEVEPGESFAMMEVNMLYNKGVWDAAALAKFKKVAVPLLFEDDDPSNLEVSVWKATGVTSSVPVVEGNWGAVHGYAYWYAG